MRPSFQIPTGTPSRPPQGVMGTDPRGGNLRGPSLPNSNISSSWPGGVTNIATSQAPNRGTSPSMAPPKPQDPRPTSPLVGSGNGFGSDPMFGGDVFSVTRPLPKQASSAPASSTSSVISPATSGPQSSVKPDPLGSLQPSQGSLLGVNRGRPSHLRNRTKMFQIKLPPHPYHQEYQSGLEVLLLTSHNIRGQK